MLTRILSGTFFRTLTSYSSTSIFTSRLTHHLANISEGSCEYPAIFDTSEEGRPRHERKVWYDSIKAMPTVEAKLFELVVQQREDIKKYVLSTVPPTYTGIFFQRYITRTHLIHGLPDKLMEINVDDEFADISDVLNEVLNDYYCNSWSDYSPNQLSKVSDQVKGGSNLVYNLISKCFKKMALKNDYIMNSTIHVRPRINSFWWHGGFQSAENLIHEKNLVFNYDDRPAFIIRMNKPLSPIVRFDDPLCATADIPDYNFQPEVFTFKADESRHLASMPGFWPGDPHEFPLLIVNTSNQMLPLLNKIERYDLSKIEDSLGIMSSFGCLNAFATQQGFTPFHDVTYPFVAQSILTNGRDWTFFMYQLNTIALHSDVDNKDRRNICWSSGKLSLFDTIEDGQVKGVNDEVFKTLLKFLLNAPALSDDLVLKPYLGKETRGVEEINSTHQLLRVMYSQAPDRDAHRKEIPTWQKIYKFHPDAPLSPYIKME